MDERPWQAIFGHSDTSISVGMWRFCSCCLQDSILFQSLTLSTFDQSRSSPSLEMLMSWYIDQTTFLPLNTLGYSHMHSATEPGCLQTPIVEGVQYFSIFPHIDELYLNFLDLGMSCNAQLSCLLSKKHVHPTRFTCDYNVFFPTTIESLALFFLNIM